MPPFRRVVGLVIDDRDSCYKRMIRKASELHILLFSILMLSWQALLPALANAPLTDASRTQYLGAHVLTGNPNEGHRHGKTKHMGTKHCLTTLISIGLSLQSTCPAVIDGARTTRARKWLIERNLQSATLQIDPPIPRP